MTGAPSSWCADEVRRLDHDRYLTALFAPKNCRAGLFGLYALNLEIARTREIVSEPMLGRIRLQWWRDRLGELDDGAPAREHPVLQALAEPVRAGLLPRTDLEGMIDARESDLDDDPPADLPDLEGYAAATSGALATLAVRLIGAAGEGAQAAARDVGTAWALVGLMRAVAFHAQARRLFLPDDLLRDFGIDRQALLDLKPAANLDRIVRAVIERAGELLAAARNRRDEIPKPGRSPLLLATLADAHIADIARHGYDVFALPPATPPRPVRLLWAHWRGRY